MRYDAALIRGDEGFFRALAPGAETGFGDQYMYMVPQFEVGDDACAGLAGSLFIARGWLAGPKRIGYEVARVV